MKRSRDLSRRKQKLRQHKLKQNVFWKRRNLLNLCQLTNFLQKKELNCKDWPMKSSRDLPWTKSKFRKHKFKINIFRKRRNLLNLCKLTNLLPIRNLNCKDWTKRKSRDLLWNRAKLKPLKQKHRESVTKSSLLKLSQLTNLLQKKELNCKDWPMKSSRDLPWTKSKFRKHKFKINIFRKRRNLLNLILLTNLLPINNKNF